MSAATLSTPALRKLVRWSACSAYFACLLLAGALLGTVLATLLWEVSSSAFPRALGGVDDDWALTGAPIGAGLGAWLAVRTRGARRFHVLCAAIGAVLVGLGLILARRFLVASRSDPGEGTLAGFGELIVGLLFGIVAVIGGLLLGAALFGALARSTAVAVEP